MRGCRIGIFGQRAASTQIPCVPSETCQFMRLQVTWEAGNVCDELNQNLFRGEANFPKVRVLEVFTSFSLRELKCFMDGSQGQGRACGKEAVRGVVADFHPEIPHKGPRGLRVVLVILRLGEQVVTPGLSADHLCDMPGLPQCGGNVCFISS